MLQRLTYSPLLGTERRSLWRAVVARSTPFAPIVIVVVALVLRLYGYNFDDGQLLQPDERAIDMTVSTLGCCLGINAPATWPNPFTDFFNAALAPYNPHTFNYGSLPFYLLALVTRTAAKIGAIVPGLSAWQHATDLVHINWIGRWLSALFDTASLIVLYRLARRVFDSTIALLTLFLSAFTVLEIQLSHFYAVDTLLTFFVLLTLWAAVVMVQENRAWAYLVAGASFGAALAVKTSAIPLVLSIIAAALLPVLYDFLAHYRGLASSQPHTALWNSGEKLWLAVRSYYTAGARPLNRSLALLLAAFIFTVIAFAIGEPYGLIDHQKLVADIQTQNAIIVTHSDPVPYTIQYVGTKPYWYDIKNLVLWDMGIPLGVAALLGTLWVLYQNLGERIRPAQFVVLLWVVPYFIIVGRFWAKFSRYMLPIMPLLTMFGAALLIYLVRRLGPRWRPLTWSLIGVVAVGTLLWAVAFMHIYTVPNTRVQASEWIYAHIKPGTPFATEGVWDDSLPLCLPQPGECKTGYNGTPLDGPNGSMYDPDTPLKVQRLVYSLTHDQYIIMSSERFIDSIPREPDVYPITTRFYKLLFHNQLNFRLYKHFVVHPQLGPLVIDDFSADESFHVYDHPDVRIFRRIGPISPTKAAALLTSAHVAGLSIPEPDGLPPQRLSVVPPPPVDPTSSHPDTRLMLSPQQWAADQKAPTFDQLFPPHGFGMSHPLLVWVLLIELLGLAAFPLTFFVFRGLRDRGYVIAKTFGLLLTGWLVWIVVSVGLREYTRSTIWLAIGLLIAAGLIASWRQWPQIEDFLRYHYRDVIWGEAIFLAGFAAFVLLRMWYPDLGHQFSSVSPNNLGAGRMGEKQMELAFLNAIVRSRTFPPPDPFFAGGYINYYYFGYVLVGTLCKATTIAPVVGFNLAIPLFFGLFASTAFSIGLNLTRSYLYGVVATIFTAAIGNLNGLVQLVRDLQTVATFRVGIPVIGGPLETISGAEQVLFFHHALPAFDYWESTRLVPPVGIDFAEFPYFTYLFADLHPHLMAFPMTLAAFALALSLLLSIGRHSRGQLILTTIAAGFLLGAIAATNPWDFPTYLLVLVIGVFLGSLIYHRTQRISSLTGRDEALVSAVTDKVSHSPTPHTLDIGSTASTQPHSVSTMATALAFTDQQRKHRTNNGQYRAVLGRMLNDMAVGRFSERPAIVSAVHAVAWAVAVALVGLILFLPFKQSYQTVFQPGIATVHSRIPYLRAQFQAQTNPVLTPTQIEQQIHTTIVTPLSTYLEIFGLFLFVISSWLVVAAYRDGELRRWAARIWTVLRFLMYHRERFRHVLRHFGTVQRLQQKRGVERPPLDPWLVAIGLALAVVLATRDLWLLAFLSLLAGITSGLLWAQRERLDERALFVLTVLFLPIVISAFTEIFFLKDWLAESSAFRMNTVAKLYNQVWVLYALVATAALASFTRLLRFQSLPRAGTGEEMPSTTIGDGSLLSPLAGVGSVAREQPSLRSSQREMGRWLLSRHPWWSAGFAVLLLGSLIYTYAGTVSRETVRQSWLPENSVPFTLNGMAFMKVAYPNDYAAINWLNAHVHGTPPIVEADDGFYDWRSRVAEFTGLPALIGGIHESEQRYGDEIAPRSAALETIYSGTAAQAQKLLQEYHISYIYVGLMEEEMWPHGILKFHHMPDLHVVFHRGEVTIYHVRGSET